MSDDPLAVELPDGADDWPREAIVSWLSDEYRCADLPAEIDAICGMPHDTDISTHQVMTKAEIATILLELGGPTGGDDD